ncbi:GGDEF domain-containing protein [Acidisoma silvae]|uniref:diguanylate cyclase n=1 Tax=Acidisoma silvae TaxID=2802396 RepID=A0A963YVW0_9PROT|nr:diguanylate cyclase [Acidisoma silvae]MCB8877809.1 diguanylate cyclase [Acidisoma silvae]
MRQWAIDLLRRWPVKHRLLLAITAILLPAVVVSLVLQLALHASNRRFQATIDTTIKDLLPVARLEFHIEQVRYDLERTKASPSQAAQTSLVDRINEDFRQLKNQGRHSQDLGIQISHAFQNWQQVEPFVEKELAATKLLPSSSELSRDDQNLEQVIDQLQKVHAQLLSAVYSRYKFARGSENDFEKALILTWLVGFSVAGGMVYLLSLSIIAPLRDLKNATAAVKLGHYDARVPQSGHDELSELGEAFNGMAATIAQSHEQLYDGAMRDPLTGLLNRRGLDLALRQGSATWKPLSLVILDLDHFKSINDRFGHEAGDTALIELGQHMVKVMRPGDSLGRYGGDEFLMVFPGLDGRIAVAVAQRLIDHLKQSNEERLFPIEISVGVADKGFEPVSATSILQAADKALYQAKAAGRGTVRAINVAS